MYLPFIISISNLLIVSGLFFCFVYLFYMFYTIIFAKKLNSELFKPDKKNLPKNIPVSNTDVVIIKKINKVMVDNIIYQFVDLGNGKIIIMKQDYYEPESENELLTNELIDNDLSVRNVNSFESHNDFNLKTPEEVEIEESIDNDVVNNISVFDQVDLSEAIEFQKNLAEEQQRNLFEIEALENEEAREVPNEEEAEQPDNYV